MKIATFNCNSVRTRLRIILDWLGKEQPDVLCLQETKVQDVDFPHGEIESAGYSVVFNGQKCYNGVAILSRSPLTDVRAGMRDCSEEVEQARFLCGVAGGVAVVNTYVPQGFEPDTDKFEYKLNWLRRLKEYFERNYDPTQLLVWVGDFNIAPKDEDVHDPVSLAGHVGLHPKERAALEELRAWGFEDVLRRHVPEPGTYTFWDYRMPRALDRNLGWRIDHVWATLPLAERSTGAWIDKSPRKLEKPSDHTFLIAEFNV